jgi:group II intron reverse transcriptase/maturase
VKRTYVPKEDGSQRPIGMPTFEDKLVQRAGAMRLGAIDEQAFPACADGFREGRRPQQARHVWRERCLPEPIGWIVDADGRACFDSLDHDWWCAVRTQRVQDGAILRLIRKWLKAGVREGDTLSDPERGSPQGGVLSPLLAHVFLEQVLAEGVEREVKPRMRGRCFLLRLADDFVMGWEREDDARRMLAVLPKRFARFQRTMHPQKTRLVEFQPPRRQDGGASGDGTFDCLGLTHDWARARRGYWVITRRTAKTRRRRARRAVWHWCRTHRHDPWRAHYRQLGQTLRGSYQYDGIRGNDRKLAAFYRGVEPAWRFWWSRRGGPRTICWERFATLRAELPLPPPRIVHSL